MIRFDVQPSSNQGFDFLTHASSRPVDKRRRQDQSQTITPQKKIPMANLQSGSASAGKQQVQPTAFTMGSSQMYPSVHGQVPP
jgi:hypothetical protein